MGNGQTEEPFRGDSSGELAAEAVTRPAHDNTPNRFPVFCGIQLI